MLWLYYLSVDSPTFFLIYQLNDHDSEGRCNSECKKIDSLSVGLKPSPAFFTSLHLLCFLLCCLIASLLFFLKRTLKPLWFICSVKSSCNFIKRSNCMW